MLFECVINLSEGRDTTLLAELDMAAGPLLRDRHRDPDHHRSVFTLVGPGPDIAGAARDLATAAIETLDLGLHRGAHPRLGVVDVVPFVPYDPGHPAPADLTEASVLRDDFTAWLGDTVGVPAFRYGPLPAGGRRTLPEVRRQAFGPAQAASPNGPAQADPTAGACAVGARRVLVAYNVWVSSVEVARQVAPLVRGPAVRALGLAVGARAQVSCNLIDPDRLGPARLYDEVAALVGARGRRQGRWGPSWWGSFRCRCSSASPRSAGPNSICRPSRRWRLASHRPPGRRPLRRR